MSAELSIYTFALFAFLRMFKTYGPLRLGVLLFGLSVFTVYVLTVSNDYVRGIPSETFVIVSGMFGVASLWSQLRNSQ